MRRIFLYKYSVMCVSRMMLSYFFVFDGFCAARM